ncbi:MAG TPA: winged helix-turn-helix domain-containing protein [Terriglobia bacterium]|nr:winged helix-turn-helix domain-containing protein [Terriglobia bacterium]
MLPPPTTSRLIRFGPFEVDPKAGEVHKDGVKIRLQVQPFQVLAMLLEHAGDIVTREELRHRIWPDDTFVDFDQGLNKAINKIREALGDSPHAPRFIETLPKRGYRFIASMERRSCRPESSPNAPKDSLQVGDSPVPGAGVEDNKLLLRASGLTATAIITSLLRFLGFRNRFPHREPESSDT